MQTLAYLLKCKAIGRIRIEHIRNGKVIGVREVKNLITTAGKAERANLLIAGGTAPTHVALGTGITAADVADTTLETETHRGAVDTASRVTTAVTNDTARFDELFAITSSHSITESGLLNAGAAGTLFCRQTFTVISVINGDNLRVYWDLQMT